MKSKENIRNLLITVLLLSMLMFSTMLIIAPMVKGETPATIWTDKQDYSPGETVTISGSGFLGNSVIIIDVTRPDLTMLIVDSWNINSDADGNFETTYQLNGILGTYNVTATDGTNKASTTFTDAPPKADLDQLRNGPDDDPWEPPVWFNGNAGKENAHYIEGYSIPYRCVMTDMPTGKSITLVLKYDIRHSGKNAIDYLTYYDRMNVPPHQDVFEHPKETVNPLAGVSGVSATTSKYTIPKPSSGLSGQPGISYDNLVANEGIDSVKMTLFGGTITGMAYVSEGSLTADSSETLISVTFTLDSFTAVLAWGGHIASRVDWGFTAGVPNSAGGISGSPYHMALDSWTWAEPPKVPNLGSTDRSLSAVAVYAPPGTIVVIKNTIGGDGTFTFTGTGGDGLPASFSITTVSGTGSVTYNNIDPDLTYSVVETVPGGWKLVGYVVSTGEPNTAFHVAAGGTTTITVTDKKLGTIVVVKNTIGGDGTFSFTGTGGSTLPASFSITTSGLTGSVTYTNVDPDLTYGIVETVPGGWKLVGYVVSTGEPNTAFHVAAGGTTTVTVTDKKLGTIVVVKNTIGGNGAFDFVGTGTPSIDGFSAAFTITTSGGTGSQTFNNIDPDNTYGVTETLPSGWKFVSVTVSTGEPNTAFTVAPGGTTTVTFTDKKLGTIIVVKNTIGGNGAFDFTTTGGDNLPGSFSITTVANTGSQTYNDIDPDLTYGVVESVPGGWKLVGYVVSTGESNTAFHVAAGGTTTITVTDKKLGTIVVVKNTIGGDDTFSFTGSGGDGLPGSFSITTSGLTGSVTYNNIDPDLTYGVVETVPSGWKLVGYSVSTGQPNTAFTVAPGGTTTVTVTNKKLGTIIVVKNTIGGDGTFSFTGSGGDGLPASFSITTSGGTGSQTYNNIDPDLTYSVVETVPGGWKFVSSSVDPVSAGTPGSFTVAPGGTTTVTFNDKKLGTIVVVKNTIGGDGTFSFTGTGGSTLPASFSITTSGLTGSQTYTNIDPDLTYGVVETVPSGWKLVGYVVSTAEPNTAFHVAAGGTTTVTVTDKKLGTIVVVKNTIGGDGTFGFTGSGGSTLPISFSITTVSYTGSVTYNNIDPDNTYSVVETSLPADWKLVSYVVSTGEPNTAFHVAAGGTTTVTVTDEYLPPLEVYILTVRAELYKCTIWFRGVVKIPGGGLYDEGTIVTLRAPSLPGCTFIRWYVDGVPMRIFQRTIQVLMDGDHTAVAVYRTFR